MNIEEEAFGVWDVYVEALSFDSHSVRNLRIDGTADSSPCCSSCREVLEDGFLRDYAVIRSKGTPVLARGEDGTIRAYYCHPAWCALHCIPGCDLQRGVVCAPPVNREDHPAAWALFVVVQVLVNAAMGRITAQILCTAIDDAVHRAFMVETLRSN